MARELGKTVGELKTGRRVPLSSYEYNQWKFLWRFEAQEAEKARRERG